MAKQGWIKDNKAVYIDGVACYSETCPPACDDTPADDPSEYECFCCEDGEEGKTPTSWEADVPAAVDNACGDCESTSATVELTQGCCGQPANVNVCDFENDGANIGCGLDYHLLNVVCGEENYISYSIATASGASAEAVWRKDFGSSPVCTGSHELTYYSGTGAQCDWTGTTVTVTSSIA